MGDGHQTDDASESHNLYFRQLGKKLVAFGLLGIAIAALLLWTAHSPADLDAGSSLRGTAFVYFCSIPATCTGLAMWAAPGPAKADTAYSFSNRGGFEANWTDTPLTTRLIWLSGLILGTALMSFVEMWLLTTHPSILPGP